MFSEKSDSMSKLLALITLTFILNACAGGIVEDPRSALTLREAQDLAREQKSGGYSGRWQTLENNPSCVVWNPGLQVKSLTTWSGACVNGKAQGRGTSIWRYFKDGDWKETEYTGEMKNGKWHGRGVSVFMSGDRYEGEFKDGKQHGRGIYVGASGGRYEGEWKDGKQHGRGVAVFANGDKCEGDWRGNKLLGTGEAWQNGQFKKCYMDGNTIKSSD